MTRPLLASETLSDLRKQIHGKLFGFAKGEVTPAQMKAFAVRYRREFEGLEQAARETQRPVADVTYSGRRDRVDLDAAGTGVVLTVARDGHELRSGIEPDDRDASRLSVAELLLQDAISAKAAQLLAPLLARSERFTEAFSRPTFQISINQLRAFVAKENPKLLTEQKPRAVR